MFPKVMAFGFVLGLAVMCSSAAVAADKTPRTQADEIRHQIVMSPYYGVFDWVDAEVQLGHTVILSGQVRHPYLKSDAEARIRKVEGVTRLINNIEILPVSQSDDNIRLAMYRAIFRYNGPLFRYANSINPSIHIVVKNGRVTLKGAVGNSMDRQLAYMAARYVSGVFEVSNDLTIDNS